MNGVNFFLILVKSRLKRLKIFPPKMLPRKGGSLMKRFLVCIVVLAFVFMTGCSKAPIDKIENAKKALESAQNGDVPVYAPDALKAAEDKAAAMEQELTVQKGKFFKDYKLTDQLVTELLSLVEKANDTATKTKEAIRSEADTAVKAAEIAATEARDALQSIPTTGRKITIDIPGLTTVVESLTAEINQAKKDLAESKYSEAKDKSVDAKLKAEKVKLDIQTAIDASLNKNKKK